MLPEDTRTAQQTGDENHSRRVGEVLADKWRLDRLLGVGGMAAVYAATHRNGNRVAIKILHAHCATNEGIRTRFQREGYMANMIEHPGAVRVLDDGVATDRVFLVMELLEGETLEARIGRGGRLRAREALAIGDGVLDVLAAAHDKGIVHRDVKLDNVFLTSAGEVKVLDFGIARLAESPEFQRVGRTQTGSVMGTPAFMAPEQALARSGEIDAQTDVWAVGATLFKALTGRYVHEATTMNEQLVQAATRPAPPLASVLPDAPAALAGLVDRALAFHKAERWASARAMQEAVRAVLQSKQPTPAALPTPTPVPPVQVTSMFPPPPPPASISGAVPGAGSPSRRRGLVIAGIAVVAASLGFAGWTSWRAPATVAPPPASAPAASRPPPGETTAHAVRPPSPTEASAGPATTPTVAPPSPPEKRASPQRSRAKAPPAKPHRPRGAVDDDADDMFARRH